MAVISTTRLMRSGAGGSVDERFNRNYEVVYQVITNDQADGAAMVLLAPGLPGIYSIYKADHEYDTGSILKSYSPRRTDDPCVWEVTCKYESWAQVFGSFKFNPELLKALADAQAGQSSQQNPGGFDSQNPVDRPARVSVGCRTYQRAMEKDKLGRAPVNAAGDKFDPPIEMDDNRPTLTITRNEASPLNFARICQYQDAINSDSFLGQPAYSAKMRITANRQFENKTLFWEVTYDIEFRNDLWDPYLVLDAGYNTLQVGNLAPGKRIMDVSGTNPAPMPVRLYTVTGNEFPALSPAIAGDVIQLPAGLDHGSPYSSQYRQFRIYNVLPFAVFGITVNW